MTQLQQDGPGPVQALDAVLVKPPISDRRLQANRANAKRSTGPRTEAGKAASRRNALKHGILSLSVELPPIPSRLDLRSLKDGFPIPQGVLTDPVVQEINRIWEKMARVLAFERDCMQHPDGLEQSGQLIHRYERMLTRQLHDRIRERDDLPIQNAKNLWRAYEAKWERPSKWKEQWCDEERLGPGQ